MDFRNQSATSSRALAFLWQLRSLVNFDKKIETAQGWPDLSYFAAFRFTLQFGVFARYGDLDAEDAARSTFQSTITKQAIDLVDDDPVLLSFFDVGGLAAFNPADHTSSELRTRQNFESFVNVVTRLRTNNQYATETDLEVSPALLNSLEPGPTFMLLEPIWPEKKSKQLRDATERLLSALIIRPLYGQFWREWYQGFLDGKPMDWELQRRVALIEDAIWESGPEAVAEEIERIRAEFLSEKTPQAERVEFNQESAKFFTVPIEVAKPDLLGATLTQVEDALDDALANPSNGLHDQSREVRVLRRVATKYGNDPQQIEMGFVSVHAGLTRQILSDELPPSEENLALQAAVEEGARAIRATHPEVAENRKILSEQVIRELPEGAKEKLEAALPMLRAISEPALADDWDHDIPTLINDATGPLPSGAPALPGADEATRIFSRVAKISILIRTTKAIKSHPLYESGEVLLTLKDLILLGATIFALLM